MASIYGADSWTTLVLALVATAAATATLCVAMRRQQRLVFSGALSPRQKLSLQTAGYAGLLLAAFLFARAMGSLVGLTFFAGWFTVCMIGIALAVTWLLERRWR